MSTNKWDYPAAKNAPETMTSFSHGTKVPNPYKWLEDLNSPEVQNFAVAQNNFTSNYLNSYKGIDELKNKFKEATIHQTKLSCPTECAGKIIFYQSTGESDGRDCLYIQESVKSKAKILISPNEMPNIPKSSTCFLRMYRVSLDGKTLAYAYSTSKNDEWIRIRFMDIRSGSHFSDELTNVCKSDICWTHDNEGILYSCFLKPLKEENHKICFHRPGTPQLDDIILVEFPVNPAVTLQAQISDCGSLIYVYAQEYSPDLMLNHFFYGDFTPSIETQYNWTPLLYHLFEGEELDIQYITDTNNFTYFRTNIRAPNYRIMRCRLFHEDPLVRSFWETIIAEDKQRLLQQAACVNQDYLMVGYLKNCVSTLELHSLTNGVLLHKYSLPIGTITGFSGDQFSANFYFTFTSFMIPDRVYYVKTRPLQTRIADGCCRLFSMCKKKIKCFYKNDELEKALGISGYCSKQHFCKNKADGTLIPIFVIRKKGMKKKADVPCIVYGQGCFGLQVLPSFSLPKLLFIKHFNGMIAIVGVRGGGEVGEKWYHEGVGKLKQNTYDDFITAVEYLINCGYTSPSKLLLEGVYLGGNLAGVCMIQRPDLFGAVVIQDGLLDMLNFKKFPQSLAWETQFGDPDDLECFKNLEKLSPLHNLPQDEKLLENFPAVLLIIEEEHAIVHPVDSLKCIAQLQQALQGVSKMTKPVLLKITSNHFRQPVHNETVDKANERVDILAFLALALGNIK